jgi:putative nucleotidyltransferase with HDIG domain
MGDGDEAIRAGRKRILFVDDEAPILDSLKVRLHRLHGKWDMRFVDSGARALEDLESAPCDVVVTDMRMPGMDGAELLRTVSERFPETVRVVLSGYSELRQIVRLVPYAHQYLAKPCEAPQLENLIDRCLQVQELLGQPTLRAVAGRIRKLPAMPRVYAQLRSMLADDSATVEDVAKVVAADPAIAAKILQIVNSAFFRLSRRISSVQQAVTYLGFSTIRNLALSAELFTQWPQCGASTRLNLDRLQRHVHAVAGAAQALTANTPLADDALLAGLLHDIGYWVLAQECEPDLARSVQIAAERKIPLHQAETEVIGASHAQIGAYLLGIWGLPYQVIEAVAHHHEPRKVAQSQFDVLAALAVAHSLTPSDDASVFDAPLPPDSSLDPDYLVALNAPFDWTEAARRVAASLSPEEE